jgi:carbon storage regulator
LKKAEKPGQLCLVCGFRGVEFGSTPNITSLEGGYRMLVLSRKLGEKIYISENICITVVDIDRGKIRLGIEAPREVPIFRQELLQNQDKQPPAATTTSA